MEKKLTTLQEIKEEFYPTGSPEREQYEKELKQELILESNKILAKYLGYEYLPYRDGIQQPKGWWLVDRPKVVHPKVHYEYFLCRTHKELRFYNDWNLLMRVYEKLIHAFEHDDESMKLLEQADNAVVCANKERFFFSLVRVVQYLTEEKDGIR